MKITLLNVTGTAILTHGLVLSCLWLRSCEHEAQGLVPTPGGFSQASAGPGVWRASYIQRKVELAGESQLTRNPVSRAGTPLVVSASLSPVQACQCYTCLVTLVPERFIYGLNNDF